ncbi:hypothetical protein [Methyloprofundus sp.]|uniref:hypothetical protein n=1 Tax=Methyloprofundus sp. TaxID=2020875 RepID=UPI003D09C347
MSKFINLIKIALCEIEPIEDAEMKNILYLAILPLLLTVTTAYSETCPSIPNYNTATKILNLQCLSVNGSPTHFRVDMQGTESEAGLSFTPTLIERNPYPYVDISNPENPMEWVGRAHNDGVRFVLIGLDGVREPIVDNGLREIDILHSNILELTNDYFNVELTTTLDGIELSPEEAIAKLHGGGAITDRGKQILTEFFNILPDDEMSLPVLISRIRDFEESISNSYTFPPVVSGPTFPDPTTRILVKPTVGQLTTNDLRVFYSIASIARHSAKLWAPKEQGGDGTQLRIKWWKILIADAVGGVIGGVPGAVGVSTAVALGSD